MVLLLLAMVLAPGAPGWLMGTDTYWGDEKLEALHEALPMRCWAARLRMSAAYYSSVGAPASIYRVPC